ncbi:MULTISPECIES: hypothetical protein [Bacillus]|uniref:Lipoprotein n=1 Tax=Bacillus capparidis TaxID=1840411 RepID=A0ABS4D2R0_9BACI|nr:MULTISPECIES: hypothetical protein [Bacillus]MBP1083909.1 hypothetical protein [Bacillus capparidis]MED1098387.1 hypothetical protein [Bacillus capparidis]
MKTLKALLMMMSLTGVMFLGACGSSGTGDSNSDDMSKENEMGNCGDMNKESDMDNN